MGRGLLRLWVWSNKFLARIIHFGSLLFQLLNPPLQSMDYNPIIAFKPQGKESGDLLCEFLQAVFKRTGGIESKYFMSDDAPQYYSSWMSVFGGQPKKLLCTWHVDKAWRKHIQSIQTNDKKVEVYHRLRTILQTLSVADFRKMMQQCISWMLADPQLQAFGNYYQTYYAKLVEEWAFCYRIVHQQILICSLSHSIDA